MRNSTAALLVCGPLCGGNRNTEGLHVRHFMRAGTLHMLFGWLPRQCDTLVAAPSHAWCFFPGADLGIGPPALLLLSCCRRVREQQDVLRPYCSLNYAWDEPAQPHRLVLELPGSRALGAFNLDQASMRWFIPHTALRVRALKASTSCLRR